MRAPKWTVIFVVALVASIGLGWFAGGLVAAPSTTKQVALGVPHFVDETAASGVSQTYDGDAKYSVGGGVAVFDCNGDGKPDMYVPGGAKPAQLYMNESAVGGAIKFTRQPSQVTDLTGVMGAYPIDIDGDGKVDLAVLRVGETELLRGLGGCRFEQANAAWGFNPGSGQASAFSATWERGAKLPTLAVGRYLKLDQSGALTQDCDQSQLFRPNGDGSGYAAPVALAPGYCTLSMLFSDWDRSGRRDLRLTNDRHYYGTAGTDQLWRVAPGEAPKAYTAADGWVTMIIWGMGIASYDVTGDGYPEYFLTSQADNKLQTLLMGPSEPMYRDMAAKRGVTLARPATGGDVYPSTAWHPEFEDVNNDGLIDLLVTKGNVSAQPDFATKDPSDLMLGQTDGTFSEAAQAAGIVDFDRGRGAALADFNLDGQLDLVEVFYGGPVKVWRNVGSGDAAGPKPMGRWLGLSLTESGGNRDAIGSWIEVKVGDRVQRREVTIGGGHAGGQLGPVHFGLGSADSAQVRVQWPDGQWGQWMTVNADTFDVIDRAASSPRQWSPPR